MNTRKYDPGLEAVRSAFSSMEEIAANAVKIERGFTWENGGIPQFAWAEEPMEDEGSMVSRVHAETLLVSGIPWSPRTDTLCALNPAGAGMGGLVRTADDSVSLKTTVFVHEQNLAWVGQIFNMALAVQVLQCCVTSHTLAQQVGGTPGGPPVPGPIPESAKAWMEEVGRRVPVSHNGERPWNSEEFFGAVKEFIGHRSLLTTVGRDGLTAEFPFGPAGFPAGNGRLSLLFRMLGDLPEPLLGDGIWLILVLPMPLPGPEGGEVVMELNQLEQREWSRCHFLGSWQLDTAGFPTYKGFLPAAFCHPAAIFSLVATFAIRADWVVRVGIREAAKLRR